MTSTTKKPLNNVYRIMVDYKRNVEEAVKKGKYDLVHVAITSKHFPSENKEPKEIAIELIHFSPWATTRDILVGLEIMGFRPATLHEIIALGEKYPDLFNEEIPIVALGSIWQNPKGLRFAPGIRLYKSKKCLDLYLCHLETTWGRFRFAAVKKP
jgi:hypothetical protein